MNVFKYLHRVETKNLLENLKKEVLDLNSTLNLKLPTMLMLVNSWDGNLLKVKEIEQLII